MQQSLLKLLDYGFNPYLNNDALEKSLFSDSDTNKENIKPEEEKKAVLIPVKEISTSISEALKLTLELKINMMNKNSFIQYRSRIGLFEKWLIEKEYYKNPITFVTKKIIIDYLNDVLKRASARNRNNSRTDIASMYQLLEDNEIVKDNFIKKIPVLKSVPKQNKTYTPKLEKEIWKHLGAFDSHL